MDGYKTVFHTIPPLFDENSKILILGSLPSPKSREAGFFYGHPQNRFWLTIAAVLGCEIPKSVEGRKAFLKEQGIALWDVIERCDIVGASDASIKNAVPNDFSLIESVADIRAVFTTGRTAHGLLKKLAGRDSICLPSPSPANCAVSTQRLISEYRRILQYLDEKI